MREIPPWRRRARGIRGVAIGAILATAAVAAETPADTAIGAPILWGVGVKPCSDFLAVAPADAAAQAIAGEGYRRYREWLSGLVTGLNLATGRDVLEGAELDAAMLRIRANCERDPAEDFFNAAMRLIRGLAGRTPR